MRASKYSVFCLTFRARAPFIFTLHALFLAHFLLQRCDVNVVILPFRKAARAPSRDMNIKRYAKWLLCCQLTLAFSICMLLRNGDFRSSFSAFPFFVLSVFFLLVSYGKLCDHVASYDSLATAKVAKWLACVCALAILSMFFRHLFLVPFLQILFQTRCTRDEDDRARTTAHGSHSYNVQHMHHASLAFGSHAHTAIIMWWFHSFASHV